MLRFFFYCTVCGSVASLSHTSEEGKTLLEYDSKEESLKFHLFYKFSDYVMFLFIHKRCCSRNFHDFWSCYSYILHQLHLLISCDKNLTNMFVVSISTLQLSLAENQVKQNYNKIHLSRYWKCCYTYILKFFCVQRFMSVFNCFQNMLPPQIFGVTFLSKVRSDR